MENPLYLQIMYQQKRIMAENSLCSRKQLSHLMEQFHKTFIICEIIKSNIVEEVLRFEVMQLQIEVLFSNYKISFSAKIIKDLRSKGSFAVFIAASNFHNTYIQMSEYIKYQVSGIRKITFPVMRDGPENLFSESTIPLEKLRNTK